MRLPWRRPVEPSAREQRDAWLTWAELGGARPGTLKSYRLITNRFLAQWPDVKFSEFTGEQITGIIEEQKPASRMAWRGPFSSWFAWGVRTRRLERNPMLHVQTYKQPPQPHIDVFSEDEVKILRALPYPDGVLADLLLSSGLRKAEARHLTVRRIDFENAEIHVVEGAKGGSIGVVPVEHRSRRPSPVAPDGPARSAATKLRCSVCGKEPFWSLPREGDPCPEPCSGTLVRDDGDAATTRRTTAISWTESTWNPWMGCTKVSEGCDNCYMFREQRQYGNDPEIVRRSKTKFDAPLKMAGSRLIFTCSWSDWFHADADQWRDEAWEIVRATPQHTYQILTKRPGRILRHLPPDWGDGYPNVWLGTSVETNEYLSRVRVLRDVPATLRFVSAEPLLGPLPDLDLDGVGWVITGGESGPGHRPVEVEWVRSIRDACLAAGIPFHHKQWGGIRSKSNGKLLDGREWCEIPPHREVVA